MESACNEDGLYLFNVIVWDQAGGLIFVVGAGLLLGLPPAIVVVLLEDVQQVARGDGELGILLGRVVVDGPVDPQEAHFAFVGSVKHSSTLEMRVLIRRGGMHLLRGVKVSGWREEGCSE